MVAESGKYFDYPGSSFGTCRPAHPVSASFLAGLSDMQKMPGSVSLQREAKRSESPVSLVRAGLTLTGRSNTSERIRGRRNGIIYQNLADVIVAVFCKYTSYATSCGTKSVARLILCCILCSFSIDISDSFRRVRFVHVLCCELLK
jgi:hypothetical protein